MPAIAVILGETKQHNNSNKVLDYMYIYTCLFVFQKRVFVVMRRKPVTPTRSVSHIIGFVMGNQIVPIDQMSQLKIAMVMLTVCLVV